MKILSWNCLKTRQCLKMSLMTPQCVPTEPNAKVSKSIQECDVITRGHFTATIFKYLMPPTCLFRNCVSKMSHVCLFPSCSISISALWLISHSTVGRRLSCVGGWLHSEMVCPPSYHPTTNQAWYRISLLMLPMLLTIFHCYIILYRGHWLQYNMI